MELTRGQALALEQLNEISGSSEGALEVLGEPEAEENKGFIRVRLSLATKSYRHPNGFAFRDREKLRMIIYPNFPFTAPFLYFSHARFIGAPHVQWGNYICLYQSSETEWQPSDGLYGFFQRVDQWLVAAGKGELDPEDAPLHPPIAYSSSNTQFVFDCDTPNLEGQDSVWIGRVDLRKKREGRFDVVNWIGLDDWALTNQSEHIAAAVLLSKPLPMEYPDTVDGLIRALERNGVSFDLIYVLLKAFAAQAQRDNPIYIVVGAPMRRKAAGGPLRQHLTVWEVGSTAVNALQDINLGSERKDESIATLASWTVTAKVHWCRFFENRPEVINRRDIGSNLATIQGKRILLLGCGALGSAIAEHLVRADAKTVIIVDNGLVSPGLLVRQMYADRDVGLPKSKCLERRLKEIGLSATIEARIENLQSGVVDNFDLCHVDLVINATASAPVAHAIERDLRRACFLMPLISVSVSAAAQCGSVVVKMPRFSAGTTVIDRLTKIGFVKDNPNHSAVNAFWPSKSETKQFQPEPGCSTPTFTGSSADLAAHSATLLNVGLQRISRLDPDQASCDLIPAPWTEASGSGTLHLTLDDRGKTHELRHGYEVLTSRIAQKGIAAEVSRIRRVRSDKVETGGLIFGDIDEAHERIFVDSVTGPPPDSEASEEKFLCGTSGTRKIGVSKLKQSGGSSRFIGIWHTHPVSPGRPSTDDLYAMVRLLHCQEHPPRQVVMLIIGYAASGPQPNYFLFHRRDIRIVTDDELYLMLVGKVAD